MKNISSVCLITLNSRGKEQIIVEHKRSALTIFLRRIVGKSQEQYYTQSWERDIKDSQWVSVETGAMADYTEACEINKWYSYIAAAD